MFASLKKAVTITIAMAASIAMLAPNAMADTADSATDAQIKLNQGALAYFVDKGADDAVKVLTDGNVTKYVDGIKSGDAKDGTSIDNMIASVKYIQAGNALRKLENLPELKVTDTLMAMAIADVDYAAGNDVVSSGQFAVTENVTSSDDPFHVWFTLNNGKQSHANIVSKDFGYTGFGVSQNNDKTKYPIQLQTFSATAAPEGFTAGRTMTADEYLKDLEAWKADPGSLVLGDKTLLKKLIEEAKKLHESDWAESAWKNLQDKLAAAEKVVADAKATVEQVKAAAKALSDAIKALAKPTPSKFSDVNRLTPHYEDINWLADKGITTGYPGGTFNPAGTVVRQDMAAFLYRLAGSPAYVPSASDMMRFRDVNPSTSHYIEIQWLASAGIAQGYKDGTFNPMGEVNRQDMAAFLHRMAEFKGHDAVPDTTPVFSDVNEKTPHYEDILWLGGEGITTGYEDGTFGGEHSILRQDMAAFLHRMDSYVLNAKN